MNIFTKNLRQCSNMWTTPEEYTRTILPEHYSSAMKKLQASQKEDEKLVLVYPSRYCTELKEIAEEDHNFQALITAITSKMDVNSMYLAGLNHSSIPEPISTVLQEEFCKSGLMGRLQRFIRDVVAICETFGWFVYDTGMDGVPHVPSDYLLVLLPRLQKWVAISTNADHKELKLGFIRHPGRFLQPQSTTSVMLPAYARMKKLRMFHMEAVQFASKPSFLASFYDKTNDAKDGKDAPFLDNKLVNQARTNNVLEQMVSQHVATTSSCIPQQERASLMCQLDGFVSGMSRDNLKVSDELTRLRSEISIKDQCIQSLMKDQGVDQPLPRPCSTYLTEGSKVDSAQLMIHPVDICQLEREYEKQWIAVGTGASTTGNKKRNEVESNMNYNDFLNSKREFYRRIITYEILHDWTKTSGISLAVQ